MVAVIVHSGNDNGGHDNDDSGVLRMTMTTTMKLKLAELVLVEMTKMTAVILKH